jgi:hypothetical protein
VRLGFRHVLATILLLAGVPVYVVADRLGHADAAITCGSTPTFFRMTQPGWPTSLRRPWAFALTVPEGRGVSKHTVENARAPVRTKRTRALYCEFSVSTRSAPEGIRTPNLLIRSPLRSV